MEKLKGSALSVAVSDVDGDGKAELTLVVKVGGFELPPLTIELDAETLLTQAGSFIGGLVFGKKPTKPKAGFVGLGGL